MKIALVTPRWTDTLGRFDILAQLMVVHYPLNVAILAGYVESGGHAVQVFDAQVESLSNAAVIDLIVDGGFDVVGYSVTSPLYDSAVEIAAGVRMRAPGVVHMVGGAHINVLQKEACNDAFDYLVVGEAEETIVELLDFLSGKTGVVRADIQGIIFKDEDGGIVQTQLRPVIENLDSILFQAAHLLKLDKYIVCEGVGKKTHTYISMMASRGCPYQCVFCAEPINGRKLRFRSPENIAEEMEFHFRKSNVRNFFFVDSCLTLNREQIVRLAEILIEKNLPITWSGWTRANLVDEELFSLMKRAGFMAVSIGIESGDPEVLKIIKKGVSLDQITEAFRIMRKLKIESFCSAMLGLPGESRGSVWKTIKFIRNTPGILYSTFSMATPYPGTEMFEWVKEGRYGFKLLSRDMNDIARWDDCSFSVNDLGPDDLVKLQRIGLFWIHFTPRRIYFILRMLGIRNTFKVALEFTGLARLLGRWKNK